MMFNDKETFLHDTFFHVLRSVEPSTAPLWGKMNLPQMVEHLSDSVRIANGKIRHESIITPEERLPLMLGFLQSDKEFKPETKNAMMGETPLPVRHASLEEAVMELRTEMDDFKAYFMAHPGGRVRNPIFGDLDHTAWTQLLFKHFLHHLKQFGAVR
jgi:hypothetical protein